MGGSAPRHIWNHRIHQHWADEDLSFWRLAFFPRYERSAVLEKVKNVMIEQGVSSYAIYEALGLFDIFIRAWLPRQSLERFEEALNDALKGEYLQLLESFTVTRILRHHVWDGDDGKLREPDAPTLHSRLSDEEIAKANDGKLKKARLKELEAAKVIAELSPKAGIKFFTTITSPVYSTTFDARTNLEQNLLRILRESDIQEPSLYEGGGFGRFVLMGRAPSDRFFAIPKLVTAINDLGINASFTARPYTHVCAQESMLSYEERIPTVVAQEAIDIEELLAKPESHTLEVKASLRLDLGQWLHSSDGALPESSDDIANEGVIKAIIGMLNGDGGKIVVGAIERDRRFGRYSAEEHPQLTRFEKLGNYVVVGVDDEERFRAKGWDGFLLQLQDLIASRIDPSPAGLIRISEHEAAGRTLCVLRIEPSATTWYYRLLGSNQAVKFYVREDGRTVAYAGSEADNYKRARPRG